MVEDPIGILMLVEDPIEILMLVEEEHFDRRAAYNWDPHAERAPHTFPSLKEVAEGGGKGAVLS